MRAGEAKGDLDFLQHWLARAGRGVPLDAGARLVQEERVRVYSVGHGNRSLDDLVATLAAAGVVRLVDVRRYPGSRRYPHFVRAALAASLPAAGIAYDFRGEEL